MTQPRPTAGLLSNEIRAYAWGSTTAIARLTRRPPTGAPEAELWMGAHPQAPSLLERGHGPQPLTDLIARDPDQELGNGVTTRFGARLPFLLKVLAAEQALSVQVHPTTAQAQAGYAAEEATGVPLDDPRRLYKDPHHKPEMLCALDDFDALCGFRDPLATADLLAPLHIAALEPWLAVLRTAEPVTALRTVLTEALGLDRERGLRAAWDLGPALAAAAAQEGPNTDTYAAYASAARDYPGDPGLIAALLLNHVRLQPGQAIFLDARVPHAYLRGTGVEIMANSDNVLRCGLTPKHVDTDALAAVVDFQPAAPGLVEPTNGTDGEVHYPAPVAEFALSRLDLAGTATLAGGGPQILLCTEGAARITQADGNDLVLRQGASAFVPAAVTTTVLSGEATLYRARVPEPTTP